jgi:hypothetical protein
MMSIIINYVRIAHDSICNGLITNAVTTSMMTAFPSQSVMTASVLTLDFAAVVCVNESHCAVVHKVVWQGLGTSNGLAGMAASVITR